MTGGGDVNEIIKLQPRKSCILTKEKQNHFFIMALLYPIFRSNIFDISPLLQM